MSYNKEKVNKFITDFNFFKTEKQSYKTKLNTFTTTLEKVLNNYSTPDTTNTLYKGTSFNYVLTPEKILMKYEGDSTDVFLGNSVNDIDNDLLNSIITFDGKEVFYTDVKYKGNPQDSSNNVVVQIGLDDLKYDSTGGVLLNQVYKANEDPVFTNSSTDCTSVDLTKCDNHAKLTNTPYYGLGNNEGECGCYLFDSKPTEEKLTSIVSTEVSDLNNASYLGVLMDGGIYKLKEKNFSNNYNNFYEMNNNIEIVDNSSIKNSDCHPLTGYGPNTLKVNNLGTDSCAT